MLAAGVPLGPGHQTGGSIHRGDAERGATGVRKAVIVSIGCCQLLGVNERDVTWSMISERPC